MTVALASWARSRLLLGTASLPVSRDDAFALLDGAFALGLRTIDTAQAYETGRAERVLGEWLKTRRHRDHVSLVSKVGHPDAAGHRLAPPMLADDLRDSLERLGVERLDALLLHRDDESVPVGELVDFLDEQVQRGAIGVGGVSNWRHERVEAANAWALRAGKRPLAISSPHLSLAVWRRPPWPGCVSIAGSDHVEARSFYASSSMSLIAWSSLAGGFFSERLRRDVRPTDFADRFCISVYGVPSNWDARDRVSTLAEAKQERPAVIALAYLLALGAHVYPAVASRSVEHLEELARAPSVTLTAEEVRFLAG